MAVNIRKIYYYLQISTEPSSEIFVSSVFSNEILPITNSSKSLRYRGSRGSLRGSDAGIIFIA